MRIPGVKTAKNFSRWVQARILGGALILGYHRVANVMQDEYEVCVTPKHFSEQMEIISKHTRPIHLSKLVEYLKHDSLPPKSIAVTFDDGYADNLYEAKTILEKHQIPATIFVCTGYAGEEFWWDELARLVILSNADLGTLHLDAGKNKFVWNQPKLSPESNLEIRKKFLHALYHFLLSCNIEDQAFCLGIIRNWSGISSKEAISRAMTHDEILLLAKNDLIEIGSHTRYHPMLPQLSREHQKHEIVSGKKDLEELLGKKIEGFAYPNGRATEAARQIVQDAGFTYACTSLHNVIRPGDGEFELTRFWQKNVDGDRFMQGLRLWMKL